MERRHRDWPLGAKVIATIDGGGEIAKVFKHDRRYPDYCMVEIAGVGKWVKFDDLFLIDTDRRGETPWWIEMENLAYEEAKEKIHRGISSVD